jgi:hypothetical protein
MRKIWLFFLAGILALTVVGCGGGGGSGNGGGGSSDNPSVQYSLDYFGLETGFESIYYVDVTKNGLTSYHTYTKLVAGKADIPRVYRVTGAYENESLGYKGDYIQKKGVSYYQYGDWKGANVHWEEPPRLLLTNPITVSFCSPYWKETVTGRGTVSVTAGTFTAWVLEKSYEGWNSDWGYYTKEFYREWFVPYLGFVKSVVTITRKSDGTPLYNLTVQLKSSATGITTYNNSQKALQVVDQSTAAGDIRCGLANF